MKRIITYNLNGIRSAMSKGWLDWVKIVTLILYACRKLKPRPTSLTCMILLMPDIIITGIRHKRKDIAEWLYFLKQKPDHVEYGCGFNDEEGRVLRADFGDVSVISVYMPSGTSGDERQAFKMEWVAKFQKYIDELKKKRPNLIICGDYNICHKPIDIHNPISNANSSGFLPEEREWLDGFMKSGFIDSFRYFNQVPHQYTWWSFRANARANNIGWRIDYNLVSAPWKRL